MLLLFFCFFLLAGRPLGGRNFWGTILRVARMMRGAVCDVTRDSWW